MGDEHDSALLGIATKAAHELARSRSDAELAQLARLYAAHRIARENSMECEPEIERMLEAHYGHLKTSEEYAQRFIDFFFPSRTADGTENPLVRSYLGLYDAVRRNDAQRFNEIKGELRGIYSRTSALAVGEELCDEFGTQYYDEVKGELEKMLD